MTPTEQPCRFCQSPGPHQIEIMQGGVHHGKIRCRQCSNFLGWLPKPDSDKTKYKRPAQHRGLVEAYSQGFCEMCLREKDRLSYGQTLEAHHVKEFQDGGSNERSNLWILCTSCHRLVNWVRKYHGGNIGEAIEDMFGGDDEH